ncbi:zinc-binding dehydrogenase [Kocuria sp. UBA1838]|uniref:zinc-binding dehydrogenase n=1 Tax=Kocuria sp. UBA1838 TaxID=1946673 RepID=UPI0025807716|nr:zinc-binding dehydrogenase [Kocuria sp. UBA1838]
MPTANSMGARRSEPSALLEKAAMNIHAYVVDHVDAPFRWEELTVDESVPLELAGPLACGITTGAGAVLNTANPGPGESVVVYGVGAVGLGAIMAARNSAAATIIAVDLHDSRPELAQRYGATHVINSGKEDSLERIREITGGAADYAIECTGVIAVLEEAIEAVLTLEGAPPAAPRDATRPRPGSRSRAAASRQVRGPVVPQVEPTERDHPDQHHPRRGHPPSGERGAGGARRRRTRCGLKGRRRRGTRRR